MSNCFVGVANATKHAKTRREIGGFFVLLCLKLGKNNDDLKPKAQ